MKFRELPAASRLYIATLVSGALAAATFAALSPLKQPLDVALGIYFLLALASSRFTVKIPFSKVHFSVDTAFIFIIIMLYGLWPAMLADATGKFVLSVFSVKKRHSFFKIPFNIASGVLSVLAAALVFDALLLAHSGSSSGYIVPIIGMTLTYYLINTWTVGFGICIADPQNPLTFWVKNFWPTGIGYLTAGSIATLLFILDSYGKNLGFLVTIPMAALVFFYQKNYLQKEEEAIHHISVLEGMHLSTMESLALAIDAKDPFTYGHVHRARHFALGLAKELGLTDEGHLKALSFATLVHDIGKIAIPDAILKKPGKYSDREYQVMQTHSIIGAEMLRDIPIPYPVSKIVRHHHEKWNGRGYPDGLAGEQIPFESRIMTVCDIFDAIRSERPYRPKMSRERALGIMREETGKSLDPKIAEVFLEHVDELEKNVEIVDSKILDIVRSTKIPQEFFLEQERPAGRNGERELTLFHNLSRLSSSEGDLRQTLRELAVMIASVVHYSVLVVYLPNESHGRLIPSVVHGLDANPLLENDLPFGVGISGWAFDHRTPMIAQPGPSELPYLASDAIAFQSALAIPITAVSQSIGVMTLYSEFPSAFSAEDQDLLVKVSPVIGTLIESRKTSPYRRAAPKLQPHTMRLVK